MSNNVYFSCFGFEIVVCVVFDSDRSTMLIIPQQTRDMHGVVCLITGTCYARALFTRTSVAAETARWRVKLTFYTVFDGEHDRQVCLGFTI